MGLSSNEFKRIFDNGFEQRYKDNSIGESELRCFDCGAKTELLKNKNTNRRWRVLCLNGHKWKMINFLIAHTNMRDGITDRSLAINCNINNVTLN